MLSSSNFFMQSLDTILTASDGRPTYTPLVFFCYIFSCSCRASASAALVAVEVPQPGEAALGCWCTGDGDRTGPHRTGGHACHSLHPLAKEAPWGSRPGESHGAADPLPSPCDPLWDPAGATRPLLERLFITDSFSLLLIGLSRGLFLSS
jgi:hypothetical protein